MNTVLTVLFIIIVVGALLLCLYFHFCNKYTESIIRLDEAEIRIDNNIRDKYDSLCKLISMSKTVKDFDEEKFADINKLKARRISNFDTDRILTKWFNEYEVIFNNNSELLNNDDIYKIVKQIHMIDEELATLRTYYNANTLNYNKMLKSIPTNIVGLIKKYKERKAYDLKDMHDDDYEDFKL